MTKVLELRFGNYAMSDESEVQGSIFKSGLLKVQGFRFSCAREYGNSRSWWMKKKRQESCVTKMVLVKVKLNCYKSEVTPDDAMMFGIKATI